MTSRPDFLQVLLALAWWLSLSAAFAAGAWWASRERDEEES